MKEKLSDVQRRRVEKMAQSLFCAFAWPASRKGGHYWDEVYKELKRIAETGEP